MIDQNYVDSTNEWIKQRELSIEHSKFSIEYFERSIENYKQMIEANRAQILLDENMIASQKKVLENYVAENS